MDIELLWKQHAAAITGFVRARGADTATAEEICAEAFARLLQATLKNPEAARAWLYRTAERLTIDHHRRNPSTAGSEPPADLAAAELPPADRARSELSRCLPHLLAQLPDHYREAVTLSELEGLPQQVVAERQGVSLSGAKSRIQRGRSLLAGEFARCCRFERDHQGRVFDYESSGEC